MLYRGFGRQSNPLVSLVWKEMKFTNQGNGRKRPGWEIMFEGETHSVIMNIVTFNIRVYGNSLKRRLWKILFKVKAYMCFVQETKIQLRQEVMVTSSWGS